MIITSLRSFKEYVFNRHLHLELSRLTRELNLIFTVQLTFEMATYLLYLTSLIYYLYWMIIQEEREKLYTFYDWFSIILWVSLFLVRLYIVNYICEYVTVKVKFTLKSEFNYNSYICISEYIL